MRQLLTLFGGLFVVVDSHGTMVWPPSNRHGGDSSRAGECLSYECMWFSQPMAIPGPPTLEPQFRTFNIGVNGGPNDWSRKMPWRAPGSAPVLGSGCGLAGGNKVSLFNGGFSPPNIPQGTDGITLPPRQPHTWRRGAIEDVAFAVTANHGGGYSYRLCKLTETDEVTEECFQKNPLKFAGDVSWFQYGEFMPTQPRYEFPLMKTSKGTFPPGSDWARLPIPACKLCDQGQKCGPEIPVNLSDVSGQLPNGNNYYGGQAWIDQVECASLCAGATPIPVPPPPPVNDNGTDYGLSDGLLCPPGQTQFEEVLPGISGFLANHTYPEKSLIAFSIVDKIIVPDLEDGTYLLSWRWDCEQTYQIWQNCADIVIQGNVPTPAVAAPLDPWRLYFIIGISSLTFISVLALAFACFRYRRYRSYRAKGLREPLSTASIQSSARSKV